MNGNKLLRYLIGVLLLLMSVAGLWTVHPVSSSSFPVGTGQQPKGATPTPTASCGLPGYTPWTLVQPLPVGSRMVSLTTDGTEVYAAGGGQPPSQFARYSPTTDRWARLPDLPMAGLGMLSVYAPNTGKLYLFGGLNGNIILNTTQIYAPSTHSWTTGTALPGPRSLMAGGYWNGKIYLAAGSDTPRFTPQAQLWEYDPVADTWNTAFPLLPIPVLGAAGGILDGHLLVAGGADVTANPRPWLQDYNFTMGQWTFRANLPQAVYGAGGTVVDGQFWLIGGGTPFQAAGQRLDAVLPRAATWTQIYDPFTNSWRAGNPLNRARALTAATSVGSRVLVVGGLDNGADLASVEVADSIPNTRCPTVTPTPTRTGTPPTATATITPTPTVCGIWGSIDPWQDDPTAPEPGFAIAMTGVGTEAYIAGGWAGEDPMGTTRFARYSFLTRRWTLLPPALYPREGGALVYAPKGQKLLYLGGQRYSGATPDLQIYDPATGTWTLGPPMPSGRVHMGVVYDNGLVYVVGGSASYGYTARDNLWSYDPLTGIWDMSSLPPLPARRSAAATGLINGHIYVAGGSDQSQQNKDSLFDYDIAARTWTTRTALLQPTSFPSSVVVGGRLWVLGGAQPSVQIYDPATDTWSYGPPLANRQAGAGAATTGREIVVLDGADGYFVDRLEATTFHLGVPCGVPTTTATATATTSPPPAPPTLTPTASPSPSPTDTRTVTPSPSVTPAPSPPPPTLTPNSQTPTVTPTACLLQFSDVPVGSAFYPYVRCLACRSIVSGYGDGRFGVNNGVTRGQMSKFISNAAGYGSPIPPGQQTFADVPPTQPFWPYIERAAAQGVISGYGCGAVGEPCPGRYYRPGAGVTRGQAAKFVATAGGLGEPIPSSQQTFADVPSADPFWAYVERVALHGIISGYGCGGVGEPCPGLYYRPGAGVTRGQTAKFIANTFFPNCTTPAPITPRR